MNLFHAASKSAVSGVLTGLKSTGHVLGYGAGVVSVVISEIRSGVAEGYSSAQRKELAETTTTEDTATVEDAQASID